MAWDLPYPKPIPMLVDLVAHRLAVAASAVKAGNRKQLSAPAGLNPHEWTLLVLLKNLGPSGPVALIQRGRMDKVTVSRTAQGLQRRRLIRRTPSYSDYRSHILELTDQGLALVDTLAPAALDYERALLQDWQPDEVEAFMRLLRKIEATALAVGG